VALPLRSAELPRNAAAPSKESQAQGEVSRVAVEYARYAGAWRTFAHETSGSVTISFGAVESASERMVPSAAFWARIFANELADLR
jgi:hypothetical protein